MKTITIKVSGYGECWWLENLTEKVGLEEIESYNSINGLEEDGLVDGDLHEYFAYLEDLKVFVIDKNNNETDITKGKGKYVNSKNFYSKPFIPKDGGVANAVAILAGRGNNVTYYTIELNDDEEFDPKKLQLVKSDYEFKFLPYGIVSECIMYDGKEIRTDDYEGWYDIDIECFDIVNYKLPYV
jgi:hypothetical protein